jgi:outer membrane biosynthesis protein TonB
MKTTLFTLLAFFAFTGITMAQEEQDKTQREQPPITQAQVEKDALMAQEERKKHDEEKKAAVKEEKIKAEDKKTTPGTTNTSSAKKTSTRPGKQ